MKVYVAVFVYRGVLNCLEVHTDERAAQAKAEEWKNHCAGTSYNPSEDVVVVLEREVITSETPLRELGLPRFYRQRLGVNGVKTVEQLCGLTERELHGKRLLGAKCIETVKVKLAERGLELAPDW